MGTTQSILIVYTVPNTSMQLRFPEFGGEGMPSPYSTLLVNLTCLSRLTTENNEGGYLFVYTTNFLTVKFWDYKT